MDRRRTALVLIDVQDGFSHAIPGWDGLLDRIRRLIEGVRLMGVPVLVTEQVPEKLGATASVLAEALDGAEPIPKTTFSCVGNEAFCAALQDLDVDRVIVAGVEAHVCVYQTVRDLRLRGLEVCVPYDGVASRRESDRDAALETMRDCGAEIMGVEMILTALLGDVSDPLFRSLLKLLK